MNSTSLIASLVILVGVSLCWRSADALNSAASNDDDDANRPIGDYLDLDLIPSYYKDQQRLVGDILEKHAPKVAGDSRNATAELIEELYNDAVSDREDKFELFLSSKEFRASRSWIQALEDVLVKLRSLSRIDSASCRAQVWKNYLTTIGSLYGNDLSQFVLAAPSITEYARMHAFLVRQGREAIKFCLKEATDETGLLERPIKDEDILDTMLAGQHDSGMAWAERAQMLLAEASSLDLLRGEFNVRGALKALGMSRNETDLKQLMTVIRHSCNSLETAFDARFYIYNLARLLLPDETGAAAASVSARFLKLNEYYRICLPTFNPYKKRDLAANFARNLQAS